MGEASNPWGGHAPDLVRDNQLMHDRIAEQDREIERLRAALKKYAAIPNYGAIARQALAGLPSETNYMRVAGPEASGEATGPEGDDSNMGTAPTSGPEATSSQGNAERTTPPRLYEHENYCNEHGGHLRDSPACYLARERETDDDGCSACGHATRYHFDDGAGNVVCRASSDCECCHRAESIPAVETSCSQCEQLRAQLARADEVLRDNLALANKNSRAFQAERDSVICKMREKYSAIEIADMVGLTRQRVHQILNEAPTTGEQT